jgi:hypothetical protein
MFDWTLIPTSTIPSSLYSGAYTDLSPYTRWGSAGFPIGSAYALHCFEILQSLSELTTKTHITNIGLKLQRKLPRL